MRRALSLAAVGSTLVVASAQQVSFSTIKALNTPAEDKDSWSFKGTLTNLPTGFTDEEYVQWVLDNGATMELVSRPSSPSGVSLDKVIFDADECKAIGRPGTGVRCKTDGATATATKIKDKSGGPTTVKVSATVRRREFDVDTLETPLAVQLTSGGGVVQNVNGDCVEKEGAKGQLSATCKPSANLP